MLGFQGLVKIARLVNIVLWFMNNDYHCAQFRKLDFLLNSIQRFLEGLTCLSVIPGLYFYKLPILILYHVATALLMFTLGFSIIGLGDSKNQAKYISKHNIEEKEEIAKSAAFLFLGVEIVYQSYKRRLGCFK